MGMEEAKGCMKYVDYLKSEKVWRMKLTDEKKYSGMKRTNAKDQ